jgi:hypothetical protein
MVGCCPRRLARASASDGGGRRDAMANTLVLARLFQMLLVRANNKEILTAAS